MFTVKIKANCLLLFHELYLILLYYVTLDQKSYQLYTQRLQWGLY